MLSDHPLSTSGVGCQARFLIDGLLATGKYSFRCFGAALKHTNYETVVINEDFIIKPLDGFGTKEMLRVALATEKPDALFLFTDPRFFIWLWEMEEEIHQICPIVYWHVWDNDPWPSYNRVLYESTDLVNCHSYKTYELVKERFPKRTNFIPHALPQELFYPMPDEEIKKHREISLGHNKDCFVGFWVNRNARRKMPGDLLDAWRIFLDRVKKEEGKANAILLMHTDPFDAEGPNLVKITENFNIENHVIFSPDRVGFDKMNILHNMSDFCINIACNEGFGLGTLEAMQTGTPIIALKTGGLTRQVVDHRDGTENGIALDPDVRDLVGSQMVPFIYEDHVSNEKVADAIYQLYKMGPSARQELGKKARQYALSEFSIADTIDMWDKSLFECIENWRDNYSPWEMKTL